MSEGDRPATHFKIGRLLLNKIPPEQRVERIFDIVYQLNFGLPLISDQPQRDEFAQLNLIAGKRAQTATAYQSAVAYLQSGIDWLALDSWDNRYKLTLALHEAIAEAAMLSGDFTQVLQWVAQVLAHARTVLDTTKVYDVQISAYTHHLEHRVAERTMELEQANQELQLLANLDGLTQVANRRRFDEYLAQQWNCLAREQQSLALVLCDVDHFKRYNDYYGHQQGDDCLQQLANVLRQEINRPADLVARYGGEEFALVLPFTTEDGATAISQKIQQTVHQLRLPHARSKLGGIVTLSLGVASIIPTLDIDPASLIKAADMALYAAKEQGRDRWVYL